MSANRAPLSRARIVSAALSIIDREGLSSFSMRRLGRELEVEAMAVYRHFASKESLLYAIVERLADEFAVAGPEAGGWESRLKVTMCTYRDLAHNHPGAFRLMTAKPRFTTKSSRPSDALFAIFLDAGFEPRIALIGVLTLVGFADGLLLEEIADRVEPASERPRDVLPIDYDQLPHIRAIGKPKQTLSNERIFEAGVELIIAGLRAHSVDG